MQRRTRRSASTIGGAAPDTLITFNALPRIARKRVPTVPQVRKRGLSRSRASRRRTPDVKNVRRSTFKGGAAPDTLIGRAAADRAGARPGARPYPYHKLGRGRLDLSDLLKYILFLCSIFKII